ncbi:MAG: DUF4033 domain-containing protein [Cyanothece sp. SIO1E1]|nr:DUF4033 domain-containing protein [Cyanothece sp. SIO1E1]
MEAANKEVYDDNRLDKLLIWFFSRKLADALGRTTQLTGYDGLVDLSLQVVQGRNAREQQVVIAGMLRSLIPAYVLRMIRTLFGPTQLVCELNAWFASKLFEWLVGPCETIEVEVIGADNQPRPQRSGLHIKKCRYLESSRCVGMCINMCKLPTQDFFTHEFGFPVTMTPNFEDLSCDMVFGHIPPPLEAEPAYHQPCFAAHCAMAKPEAASCPKVRDY